MDYGKMGKRIRNARKSKGWTQAYLGELLDSDGKYISRIERGKSKPSLEFVVKIANILEKSTDYLLQDSIDYIYKGEGNPDISVLCQKFGMERTKRMVGLLEMIYEDIKNEE
ncbi:MAG: helix-turn-helix domain-containing protein [Coprococcus sp.]